MGHVYKRGKIWWIKYYIRGKSHYESSKSQCREDAVRILEKREVFRPRLGRPKVEQDSFKCSNCSHPFTENDIIRFRSLLSHFKAWKDPYFMGTGSRYVSVNAAATYLGVAHTTLKEWCQSGYFPAYQFGSKIKIDKLDLLNWLADQKLRKERIKWVRKQERGIRLLKRAIRDHDQAAFILAEREFEPGEILVGS